MATHRLPLLFVLAGMLIAFPAHANSQETTVTLVTSDPTSADAVPIDSPLKPVVFADAIVRAEVRRGRRLVVHGRSLRWARATSPSTSTWLAGVVHGIAALQLSMRARR